MPAMSDINYEGIPYHCRAGMQRYIEDGQLPGDFLRAVICNQLVEAYGRADLENQRHLGDYAMFLYNEAPKQCWGSAEKMAAWEQLGGYKGFMAEKQEKADVGEDKYDNQL